METIYAVTSGEYSDWRVHALFLDKALAEQHAAQRNEARDSYAPAEVSEFPLLDRLPTRRVSYRGEVTVNGDGTIDEAQVRSSEHWDYDDDYSSEFPLPDSELRQYACRPWGVDLPEGVRIVAEGWDQEQVIHRLKDRAAHLAAEIAEQASP